MYAKAHPFDYRRIVNRGSLNLLKSYHKGEPLSRIQVIVCNKKPLIGSDGKPVTVKNFIKGEKIPVYEATTPYIRVIKHYDKKAKRGRTFAEMVYESVRV